jgi:hypothetical protein
VSRQHAIPYCTVKGFRRALAVLRADLPDRVDRASLVCRGLSPHAAYPVLGALRFLGLIDGRGRPRPEMAAFLDETDVDGRRACFEAAYAAVLTDLQLPVDAREEIDQVLVERHGCAPGVAAFCSTFLLWLGAESGLAVAVRPEGRRGRPPAHLSQLSATARERLDASAAGAPLPSAFGDGSEEIGPAIEGGPAAGESATP